MKTLALWLLALLSINLHAEWSVFNSTTNDTLFADGNRIGGTLAWSTDFHYVGDIKIGGNIRRTDVIHGSGSGLVVENQFGSSDYFTLGHFEAQPFGETGRDWVGVLFQHGFSDPPNSVRAQAGIHVAAPKAMLGTAASLTMGKSYAWSYDWNPATSVLHCVFTQEDTGARQTSDLQTDAYGGLGASGFSVNAFGISKGYDNVSFPSTNRVSVSINVANCSYTTLPRVTITSIAPYAHLYVLEGQSNARGGYATNATITCSPFADSNTFIWCNGEWTRMRLAAPINNTFGMEVSAAASLADKLHAPICIIKRAIGIHTLDAEFVPHAGLSYPVIVAQVRQGMAVLDRPLLSGVIYIGGETDAGEIGMAGRYLANLNELAAAYRVDLGYTRLPIYVTRLQSWANATYQNQVRAAQEQFSAGKFINTDDLPAADKIHFNAQGLITGGYRLADAIVDDMLEHPEFRQVNGKLILVTIPGHEYRIESSPNLEDWAPCIVPGIPPTIEVSNLPGQQFFRASRL